MSAETKIAGTLEKIMPVQEISDSFIKRDIVVKTDGDYPQLISIQFVQDQVSLFDDILEGAKVEIDVNIRGREWTSPQGEVKYFNTLQGWKVSQLEAGTAPKAKPKAKAKAAEKEEDDDLPF